MQALIACMKVDTLTAPISALHTTICIVSSMSVFATIIVAI